jgi:hypothetical protein
MTVRLDATNAPGWDLVLTVRGVDVPTLSPLEAADRAVVNLAPRRPGALVRLWRWAVGEPRRPFADDFETRQLRHTVAAFVPVTHRELLGACSGGELMLALQTYLGAQEAWFAEVRARAQTLATRPPPDRPAPRGPEPRGAGRSGRVATPPFTLRPGAPMPAEAAGLWRGPAPWEGEQT